MKKKFILSAQALTLEEVGRFIAAEHHLVLDRDALESVQANRAFLEKKLSEKGVLHYGINTGFGALCDVAINDNQLEQLQENLVMSHACGMGDEMPGDVVRIMYLLKIKGLSLGFSGISPATLQQLIDLCNQGVMPVIYSMGSLGASGDLAPLAHLSLPLLGKGRVRYQNELRPAADVLKEKGINPIKLKAKEGLALLNGTQFMSAMGCYLLLLSQRLMQIANLNAALSIDAFDASVQPLHPAIHRVRNHRGQQQAAQQILEFLNGSALAEMPKYAVQDPYSFRCAPQVHGAVMGVLEHVQQVFENEINAVTDNPLLFEEENLIVSGGNFHGEPLALALDYLCMALSELGSISERRTYLLLSGKRGLPKFLVADSGLNSGFMIPQYTAAALVSQNKQYCAPASVDSIPSSDGQEDHVSMGANAGLKAIKVAENLERILAIEFISAMQALDFRKPVPSSPLIESIREKYRKLVPHYSKDREMYPDLETTVNFLRTLKW